MRSNTNKQKKVEQNEPYIVVEKIIKTGCLLEHFNEVRDETLTPGSN